MGRIVVRVASVLSLCAAAAGCAETQTVVPEGEFVVTVSDTEPRDAIGGLRVSETADGPQIALTFAEPVWPGERGGFRAVVFLSRGQCIGLLHELEVWVDGMDASYGAGEAYTPLVRGIRRVRLRRLDDGRSDVELALGPAEATDGSLEPADWPLSATAHALGRLGVTCSRLGAPDEFERRALEEDPHFDSEFCRAAADDLGLDALR